MRRFIVVCVILAVLSAASMGCRSSGSREFIPGRGWVPTH